VPVRSAEPLKRELEDFVDAVVSRRPPLVTGAQGRRALELATEITARMDPRHVDVR
jgi:predicted dehydrogenase